MVEIVSSIVEREKSTLQTVRVVWLPSEESTPYVKDVDTFNKMVVNAKRSFVWEMLFSMKLVLVACHGKCSSATTHTGNTVTKDST